MYHKKEGVCSIDFGDGFAVPLPDHPNKTKDSRRPILTNDVADHVLTKIEPDVSCGVKYVHMAQGWSEGRLVVTALWFHVSTVQQCSHVDVENVVARIRAKAVHVYKEQHIHVGGVSTQTANGVYLESGLGVMAGKGRGTISLRSNSYCTPFCCRAASEDKHCFLNSCMQSPLWSGQLHRTWCHIVTHHSYILGCNTYNTHVNGFVVNRSCIHTRQ